MSNEQHHGASAIADRAASLTASAVPASQSGIPSAKHTPGPWEVDGFADCQLITKDVPVMQGLPIGIGKIYGENQIANARLIATAPDYHAAALKLIKAADEGDADLAMEGYDDLRAAIAKATGGAA